MAQTLLSDLCSICHSETPKYRCPRCKAQTCSLPCYKRHQQRAACSGKRDPAAYVKKNDLATPTGVDRDYNYLKTVERTIEDADRLTSQRGIGVEASTWRRAASSRQPNSRLDRYLERNSITVERAPTGMSRQKTNRTRMTNAGNVQWTVEWVDGNGERRIKDDCIESASIVDLYAAVYAEKLKAERRKLEESRYGQAKNRGLKRKRERNSAESQRQLDEVSIQNETEFLVNVRSDHASTAEDEPAPVEESTENNKPATLAEAAHESSRDETNGKQDNASPSPVHISTEPSSSLAPTKKTTTPSAPATKEPPAPDPNSRVETPSNPPQHFYLLEPNTAGPSRVLIPLKPGATLTDSLRDRTVQEYPTIYVLPDPPATLEAEFMLETNYLERVASKGQESSGNAGSVGGSRGGTAERHAEESGDVASLDAKSILKMLKRDVGL